MFLAALRVIKSIYQNPERGMKKKSEYEQNIALGEAFLEAVPTTLIIFIIMAYTTSRITFIIINSYSFLGRLQKRYIGI